MLAEPVSSGTGWRHGGAQRCDCRGALASYRVGVSEITNVELVSVRDYLAGELQSPVRHEYLGGAVYAMSVASNVHNQIATNVLVALGSRLRGCPCRTFHSDTKVRVQLPYQTRFYYPDAQVVRLLNPPTDSFQDHPVVVVEVVSSSTRRTDGVEKHDAYLTIPSLSVYLLVEQQHRLVIGWRRGEHGFDREVHAGDAVIPLPEIGCELPLAEVYDGFDLVAARIGVD